MGCDYRSRVCRLGIAYRDGQRRCIGNALSAHSKRRRVNCDYCDGGRPGTRAGTKCCERKNTGYWIDVYWVVYVKRSDR